MSSNGSNLLQDGSDQGDVSAMDENWWSASQVKCMREM